ncbi:hypothetical protein EDB85DRAFT_1996982 [Lactarius pseudohatsudake]|nr:hypothetical protein EDB85DRAFT_1996982 [Lactarius pseudohatsudake]
MMDLIGNRVPEISYSSSFSVLVTWCRPHPSRPYTVPPCTLTPLINPLPSSPSMDITPSSPMQRFMIRVGLGKKRKVQRQSSLHHGRSPSRPGSGWVTGRPISSVTAGARGSVKSARYEGTLAKSGARVTLPQSSDASVRPNLARTPQPKRAKTFFGTLTNKLRVRTPAPRLTLDCILDEPERAEVQSGLHKRTSRAQAVSIALPNDIASRERRTEALRARGLLPPKSQALSAIEAEEDRRIDALQVNGLSFPGPDCAHSDAREIVQSWRTDNSMWLSLSPTTADAPVNSVPEVISPIDVSDDSLDLWAEVDLLMSGPRDSPSSVSKPLPSDAPVPSLRAASPAGFDDEQEVLQSRPASFRSPSSEGLTGLVQQSVLASSHSEENLPVVKPQTDIVTDAPSLTPSSPALSERSSVQQSSTTEEPRVLFPTSSSQRSVSPSPGSGDVSTPHSPQLPPSPRSVLSARAAPSGSLPVPLDLSASPRVAFLDASPLRRRPSELDTSLASPTSPTVPSLFCSSSSELSHSTVFTDNGETPASPTSYTMPVKGRRANLSPITVKNSDGGFLCEEIIIETTESFPEDDLDPFAASGSQSTAPVNLKVDVSAANAPRRRPLAFLGMAKKRASTLDPSSAAGITKSTSMASLRRSMTTALQARARPRSTLSPVDVPPHSPLNVTMHNGASILAQASLIDDDETRRLSELAFM